MEGDVDAGRWVGEDVVDREGELVGRVVEVFLDEASREPKWALVAVAGRGDEPVVPLTEASEEGGRLRVGVRREHVLAAPEVRVVEGWLSPEQEEVLGRHYGAAHDPVASGGDHADTATPVRHSAVEDVPALIRSEEELVVEKRRVPHDRVRVVKRVITETVTVQVQVRREELHVERLSPGDAGDEGARPPVGEAGSAGIGGEGRSGLAERLPRRLGEGLEALQRRRATMRGGLNPDAEPFRDEVVDVTLFEEEVVVTKRVVPRERVRLRRTVVSETRELHDELRKERVELQTPTDDDSRKPGDATDSPSDR